MLGQIKSFILEALFLQSGASPVPLVLAAVVFGLAALFVAYPVLERLELELDYRFFLSAVPFVLSASALNGFYLLGVSESLALSRVPVYLAVAVLFFVLTTFFRFIQERRGLDYSKPLLLTGLMLTGVLTAFYPAPDLSVLAAVSGLSLAVLALIYTALKLLNTELWSMAFVVPVFVHYLDAVSTVVVLGQGGEETVFLPALLIDMVGPYGIFLVKTVVIVPIVWYVYRRIESRRERNYLLALIALIGVSAALRNIIIAVF